MKNVFLLIAILGFFMQSQAQSVLAKDVPESVKAACMKHHPNAINIKWYKDNNTFESQFTENGKVK